MKNEILIFVVAVLMSLLLVGCNKQLIDMTYSFDRAIISLPNGEIVEGKIQSWKDFDDGDQVQVKINEKTYLVHTMNVVLISE